MTIKSYCGYCCCFSETQVVNYSDILGVKEVLSTNCKGKKGRNIYYYLVYQTKRGEI
jgi:hypothetical protein